MSFKVVNPSALGPPRGYANGLVTPPNVRLLFIAGQVGCDESQTLVSDDFVEQFDRALANVVTVVLEAGGAPGGIGRLIVYVTDMGEYRARTKEIGERWRARMGKHFPAMALVEVKSLLDERAKVEIEGIAVL